MIEAKDKQKMIEFLAEQLERSRLYKIHKHKNELLVLSSESIITMLCLTKDRPANYAKERIVEESKHQRKVGFLIYQEPGVNLSATTLSALEQVIINRLGAPKALAYYYPAGVRESSGSSGSTDIKEEAIQVFDVTQPSRALYAKTPRSVISVATAARLEVHNGYALLEPCRKQK